jgi:hypothetical protein
MKRRFQQEPHGVTYRFGSVYSSTTPENLYLTANSIFLSITSSTYKEQQFHRIDIGARRFGHVYVHALL